MRYYLPRGTIELSDKSTPVKKFGTTLLGGAVKLRHAMYDHGVMNATQVEGLKVVSVGNIRAGGSGKTPLCMFIANALKERGKKTAILLRGYKGAVENAGALISTGDGPMMSPKDAGDEAYLHASRTRGIPVWAGADREEGAHILRGLGAEVVVLDDGFQRRSLHRDLDIVLICPEDVDPKTELLPLGPLRETKSALKRAHLIAGLRDDWAGQEAEDEFLPEVLLDVRPTGLVQRIEDTPSPLEDFEDAKVLLVSGIARSERFEATAKKAGLTVLHHTIFKDHHNFDEPCIREVASQAADLRADMVVTTEKNLVTMASPPSHPPILGLRVEMDVAKGKKALEQAIGSRILNFG